MKAEAKNTRKHAVNQPVKGDTKFDLGRNWIYSGKYWELADIQHNVITRKNSGTGRLYSDRSQSK